MSSLTILSSLLLLSLCLHTTLVSGDGCVSFSSSAFCNSVISSYSPQQVYESSIPLTVVDELLEPELANFTLVALVLAPACYEVARNLLCGTYFPPCNNVTSKRERP